MRNVIEWTLVSADGGDGSAVPGFMEYQDDAYLRDGLGLLTACDAMLFGRTTYQRSSTSAVSFSDKTKELSGSRLPRRRVRRT